MSFASNYTLFVFFAVGADASERRYVSLPDTDAWKRRLLLGRSRFVFFAFDVEKFLWFDFPSFGAVDLSSAFPCEITLVFVRSFRIGTRSGGVSWGLWHLGPPKAGNGLKSNGR